MIYVTHDQSEAMTLADRIVVLSHGQVEQVGEPMELYHRPANRFVAGFIGSPRMNFLAATLHEASPGRANDAICSMPRGALCIGRHPEGDMGSAFALVCSGWPAWPHALRW
jgi:ABC-type sugar transport system ATPase subunit